MKRTMKQFWRTLVALVFAAALLSGSLPALAEDGEQSLPDWTGEVAVAGKNLAADLAWNAGDGVWTCSDVGISGIASVVVYESGMLDVVVDGDVALDGAALVDTGSAQGISVNLNVDLSQAQTLAITQRGNAPALRVSDTNGSGVDCTLMLSTNSSEATCTIDRIAVDSGATCQVLYQERAYHKSAHLQIADSLTVAEGADFNAWAIGNSYLTIAVDAGATVDNRGSMALSGTEFDNAGRIDNQGSLALEVAGFNNNGTLENSGTMRLFAANLENHSTFSNHATLTIGNAGTFENAGGTVINEDEAAQIAICDGGRFLNDAASTLENHAPLTLDGKGTFTNADFADTHCTHHSFSGDAQPTYTEPQTCYICGQAVYETDSVAPTGTLSVNGVAYTDLGAISERIAVNPGAPVMLTAQDGESGLKRLSYYIADRALTESEIAAITDWQEISLDAPTQNAVRIGPDPVQDVADVNRFAVYVRIEDNAGHGEAGAQDNVTYIGTPLCDIDKTAPVVEGIVDGGHYTGDVTFTVSDSDENPISVTLDGAEISPDAAGNYVIPADDRTHTVVVTSGTHTLTYSVTVDRAPAEEPENPDDPEPSKPVIQLHKISALPADGGSLTLSQHFAAAGQTVSVTATPEDGYALSALSVRGESGAEISLAEKSDGRRSFTMPDENVVVDAEFVATGDEPETPDAFPFIDVHPGDWFYDDVYTAWERHLVAGMTEDLYMPQRAMSRAMTVTILSRFEEEIPTVDGAWYESARVWGMENGICDGTRMEEDVTREQLATMLWRYARYRGWDVSARGDVSAFSDADKISPFADDAITWAMGTGILGGKGEGILDPGGKATRAEFAAMLNRFCALYDL